MNKTHAVAPGNYAVHGSCANTVSTLQALPSQRVLGTVMGDTSPNHNSNS